MAVCRDPSALLAPLRVRVAKLLARMIARGHKSKLHETLRSEGRSQALVAAGKSRAKGPSMHCYGVAADIICARHAWGCEAVGCKHYDVLGEEAAALGLTWGGDWDGDGVTREQREHDLPHVQAVPLSLQDEVRAAASADELLTVVTRAFS
jgi:hypothetical protein